MLSLLLVKQIYNKCHVGLWPLHFTVETAQQKKVSLPRNGQSPGLFVYTQFNGMIKPKKTEQDSSRSRMSAQTSNSSSKQAFMLAPKLAGTHRNTRHK